MTGPDHPGRPESAAPHGDGGDRESIRAGPEVDPETVELVAQIRQLAGDNPADVQQVVADVLAALDRVTGGALSEQLAGGAFGEISPSRDGTAPGQRGAPPAGEAAEGGDMPPDGT